MDGTNGYYLMFIYHELILMVLMDGTIFTLVIPLLVGGFNPSEKY